MALLEFVCDACLEEGYTPKPVASNDYLVCCAFCGAINEQKTYQRNAVDVSDTFGTLMTDGVSNVQFKELQEKNHEDFVNRLLELYLVDPTSRIVERAAEHFKAGARSIYNRMRTHVQSERHLKHATTNNNAKSVKYNVVIAIRLAIQDSNISIVQNRLNHLRAPPTNTATGYSRGDGTIMTPSLEFIFHRTQALGADHMCFLRSRTFLRGANKRFRDYLGPSPSSLDLTLSAVYVLIQRIRYQATLPMRSRVQSLGVHELRPRALKQGKTLQTAGEDDFVLDSQAWRLMARVNWDEVLEISYHLYCVQQVVWLWGKRCSINVSCALFLWAVQACLGSPLPSVTAWSKELTAPYGGNEHNSNYRRAEMKDLLVAWSTSFPEAGLNVPLIPQPSRGHVGDGLVGYASDKRRPIPEAVMAVAAAPVIAANWRLITETRLRTRNAALPIDTEFAMAARMFARVYNVDMEARKRQLLQRATPMTTASWNVSRGSSREPSVGYSPGATIPASPKRQNVPARIPVRSITPAVPAIQSIEAMLATRDESSEEEQGWDSDDEPKPHLVPALASSVPFSFTIGPQGFVVSAEEDAPSTAPVVFKHEESYNTKKRRRRTSEHHWPIKRSFSDRESSEATTIPISPRSQKGDILNPGASRQPSPALTVLSTKSGILSPTPTETPYRPSASPSLVTLSAEDAITPSLAEESESTQHIAVLLREREQYITYNSWRDRNSGRAVSLEVEEAMDSWVKHAQSEGWVPKRITPQYLQSLGIVGDPRFQDLRPFMEANRHRWSTTECLLRVGIKPLEFPIHLVPHSLMDVHQQLGHYSLEDRLEPEGHTVDEKELDRELEELFKYGKEKLRDILCSASEARKREQMFLQQGVWSQPRDVPETKSGQPADLEGKYDWSHEELGRGRSHGVRSPKPKAKAKGKDPSKRKAHSKSGAPSVVRSSRIISQDLLDKLVYPSDMPESPANETGDDIDWSVPGPSMTSTAGRDNDMSGALKYLVGESVWNAADVDGVDGIDGLGVVDTGLENETGDESDLEED